MASGDTCGAAGKVTRTALMLSLLFCRRTHNDIHDIILLHHATLESCIRQCFTTPAMQSATSNAHTGHCAYALHAHSAYKHVLCTMSTTVTDCTEHIIPSAGTTSTSMLLPGPQPLRHDSNPYSTVHTVRI